MKVLICMMGLPRSGKSTWARTHWGLTPFPIVNPDSIRLAVHGQQFYGPAEPLIWSMARIFVRSLFYAGHNYVVLDATNTTRARRDDWKSSEWTTCFMEIKADLDLCLERAKESGQGLCDAIVSMHNKYEPLGDDEPRYDDPQFWGTISSSNPSGARR